MDPDPSSLLLLNSFGYPEIGTLVIILVLLMCSALISASEVAMFSLKPSDFPPDAEEYSPKEKILSELLDKPQKLLATILVANTFVNIAVIILFDRLGDKLFGHMHTTFLGIDLQFIMKVVVVTFLILLFGEILPKIYASRNVVSFAGFMSAPLRFLDKALSVFSDPMRALTKRIEQSLGNDNSGLSVDQLSQALDLTDEEETTEEEHEILQSIVSFGNTDTRQVMQPRTGVFAVNIQHKYSDILSDVIDHGYSRVPVYEESLDNIKGILYIKDLLPYLDTKEFEWQKLLREPYFVPENKKLDDLLSDFKARKIHMAIVVDEYGGTSGLVTMEDVIEEIVGEISDEFDVDDVIFSKLDENTFIFDAKTQLIDFYRIAKIEEPELFEVNKGDSETIAGFILEISGNFPKRGEVIKFENYTFTVEAVDLKRIIQVKFSKE